jgi:hypothetical protein
MFCFLQLVGVVKKGVRINGKKSRVYNAEIFIFRRRRGIPFWTWNPKSVRFRTSQPTFRRQPLFQG